MSFLVTDISFRDFRNFNSFDLELRPGLNILVGSNAVGKTNCVEAVQLLTTGSSFKHAPSSELIREGCTKGYIELNAKGDIRVADLRMDFFESRKTLSINGKKHPLNDVHGLLPSVLFYPDDLLLIKGSAKGRRDLFDNLGCQLSKAYDRVATDYRRAVLQRNNILKEEIVDEPLFDAWTHSMIRAGVALHFYRQSLICRILPYIQDMYLALSGGEAITAEYLSTCEDKTYTIDTSSDADTYSQAKRDAFEAVFFDTTKRLRNDEIRRRQTLVGPHLDDVVFYINNKNARSYGSQGQQRSLVLSIKMAEVNLIHEMVGQYPIFLLDDVMSELDAGRRDHLLGLIEGEIQSIITTTNLSYFNEEDVNNANVVSMDA